MSTKKPDDQYTEEEAQRRFLATVNAALNTPPKPRKRAAQARPKARRPKKGKPSKGPVMVRIVGKNGGSGVLASRPHRVTFMGDGEILLEYRYRDDDLDPPDNHFELVFMLDKNVLGVLAENRDPIDEAKAKAIVHQCEARLLRTTKKWIEERGLASAGGGPRLVGVDDLAA